MDGPKRPRLEDAEAEDPLNLSLNAAIAEYPSACAELAEMRSRFQQWVLKTYRDSSKTKTITAKKYERIVRTLAGEIKNCAENSKFRFWMKCKGFKLAVTNEGNGQSLLVQDKKVKTLMVKSKCANRRNCLIILPVLVKNKICGTILQARMFFFWYLFAIMINQLKKLDINFWYSPAFGLG